MRILNCLGIRAQESPARARKAAFGPDRASNGRRQVDRWLPIFGWTTDQVWAEIARAGLRHHFAYDLGMSRLSCVFCVLASRQDLAIAVRHNRALARRYAALEARIGHAFTAATSMADLIDAADRRSHTGAADQAPGQSCEQLALPLALPGASSGGQGGEAGR